VAADQHRIQRSAILDKIDGRWPMSQFDPI